MRKTKRELVRMLCLIMPLMLIGMQRVNAQTEPKVSPQLDSLAKFARNILTFNKVFPQEKVYLHFDNTGYFMGETIWFKAYVVNPVNNRPNELSRVLYAELVSPEGRVLQTQKLKIIDGQCNGQFSLAELLHPGFYEVRAYTALMLNWDSSTIFSRVFPIFNAPLSEGKGMYDNPMMNRTSHVERLPYMREKEPKTEKINLQFFPEGGHLVEGLQSVVAFKVTDKKGNPLPVSGRLFNNRDEEISTWSTLHDGMGQFNLMPVSGETYYVQINGEKGKMQRFDLPVALTCGYTMSINNLRDDKVCIQVARNEQTDTTRALGMTVMCRGQVILFDQIQWNDQKTYHYELPKAKMPEGISQITIFDTEGRIYADRMVFISPKRTINFSLTGKKDSYRPKEMVELGFKLTDPTGAPLHTMFSLAIRDADTETPTNRSYGGGIAANLLLSSEIKGYIHNIDYYFEADDQPHRLALDLLLRTQGWRRYDWQQMANPEDFKVEYPAEEGIVIRGDLTSMFRNRAKDGAEIIIYLYHGNGDHKRGACIANEKGEFAFQAEDFNGRWIMHTITKEDEKEKEMNVNLKKTPSPVKRPYVYGETDLFTKKSEKEQKAFTPDSLSYEEEIYQELGKQRWENLLPTVKIESQKEWMSERVRRWHNLIYDMEDERMTIDETGENYLKEFVEWLEETNPFFDYDLDTGSIAATYKGKPVKFFITQVGTNGWLVENNIAFNVQDLTIEDVEAIAISDKPNAVLALSVNGMDSYMSDTMPNKDAVVISVFVRNDYFRRKEHKARRTTKVQGFTPAIQFYLPDYSFADLPDEKDFRRTLYWAPYVTTNKQGEASIRFYNTPTCQRIKVCAEAVTFGGLIGSFETE